MGVILAVLAALEGLLERLRLVLGRLEGILDRLGASWRRLGGVLGASWRFGTVHAWGTVVARWRASRALLLGSFRNFPDIIRNITKDIRIRILLKTPLGGSTAAARF